MKLMYFLCFFIYRSISLFQLVIFQSSSSMMIKFQKSQNEAHKNIVFYVKNKKNVINYIERVGKQSNDICQKQLQNYKIFEENACGLYLYFDQRTIQQSYYPLMMDFKNRKQKAMGADSSSHSFYNQNTSANSRIISFGTVKQCDENYQAIYHQTKPTPKIKMPQMPYLCHSPLHRKNCNKENSSSNRSKKEDCSKFSKLLENKGFNSADKSKALPTFGGLLKKTNSDTQRKPIYKTDMAIKAKSNFYSNRDTLEGRNSLQKLKLELMGPDKQKKTEKVGLFNPLKQNGTQTIFIQFDSFLSEIQCVNASKEDETLQFSIFSPLR